MYLRYCRKKNINLFSYFFKFSSFKFFFSFSNLFNLCNFNSISTVKRTVAFEVFSSFINYSELVVSLTHNFSKHKFKYAFKIKIIL